jgi:hypothetical protein
VGASPVQIVKVGLTVLLAGLQIGPVHWYAAGTYGWLEPWARQRIAARDEEDWPTVALARALALTNDGQPGPIIPRAWIRRLPEPIWPLAFASPPRGSKTVAVWSQDKDFEVSGLAVWKTGQVLRALGR